MYERKSVCSCVCVRTCVCVCVCDCDSGAVKEIIQTFLKSEVFNSEKRRLRRRKKKGRKGRRQGVGQRKGIWRMRWKSVMCLGYSCVYSLREWVTNRLGIMSS